MGFGLTLITELATLQCLNLLYSAPTNNDVYINAYFGEVKMTQT